MGICIRNESPFQRERTQREHRECNDEGSGQAGEEAQATARHVIQTIIVDNLVASAFWHSLMVPESTD